MLENPRIAEIARKIAGAKIAGAGLERIVAEPASDSEGNEALRIILVLSPDAAQKLTGDEALDLLVGIQRQLRIEGDDRFPIVEYATEKELGHKDGDDDPDEGDA